MLAALIHRELPRSLRPCCASNGSLLYIVPTDAGSNVVCSVYGVILMNLLLQVQTGPLPDYNAQLHNDSAKQVEPAQTEAQAKVIMTMCLRSLVLWC